MPFTPADLAPGLLLYPIAAYSDTFATTPATDTGTVGALVDAVAAVPFTQATTANQPILHTNAVDGHSVVTWDGANDDLVSPGIATAGILSANQGYVAAIFHTGSQNDVLFYWLGCGVSAYFDQTNTLYWRYGNNTEAGTGGGLSAPVPPPAYYGAGYHLWESWRLPDGTQVLAIDGRIVAKANRAFTFDPASRGSIHIGGFGGTFGGSLAYLSMSPTMPSLNTRNAFHDWVRTNFPSVPIRAAEDVKFLGNSEMFGYNVTGAGTVNGNTLPARVLSRLGANWSGVNYGSSGAQVQLVQSIFDSQVALDLQPNDVVLIWNGINNINIGHEDAPAVLARIVTLCNDIKAVQPACKIVVCALPASYNGYRSDSQTQQQALNANLRSAVNPPWDAIAALDTAPHYNSFTDPPMNDTNWYQDGVHPTDAGYSGTGELGDKAADAILSVLDSTAPTAPGAISCLTRAATVDHALSWGAATDVDNASNTLLYTVLRGATAIATDISALTFTDSQPADNASVTYNVTARDPAGNVSPVSSLTVKNSVSGGHHGGGLGLGL